MLTETVQQKRLIELSLIEAAKPHDGQNDCVVEKSTFCCTQGGHRPWKSCKVIELENKIPGLEIPWKSAEVLESTGINFLNLQLCQH